jgi:hypothetical protein
MPKLGKSEGEGGRGGREGRRGSTEKLGGTELHGVMRVPPFFSVQLRPSELLRGTLLKRWHRGTELHGVFYCLIKLVATRPKGPSNTNV